ncbi:MAG: S41 family peptidase [Gemmatimonadales bacterium]
MTRGRLLAVLVILGGALLTGSWMVRRGIASSTVTSSLSNTQGQHLLDGVMHRIESSWVDSVSADELYRRAALGMLEELGDPNTTYLPPDRLSRLREATSGSYRGIGMSVDIRDGWITVMSTRVGLPAERAGIQQGDRLVEINGQSMKGWTVDEARNALRGPLDQPLKLTVEKRFGGARVPLTLARSAIHVSSVTRAMLLSGGIGYFWITSFTDSTAMEAQNALDSLVKTGATSLIVDLRGNPGGVLAQGVAVADLFLDAGQRIVSTRGRVASANASFVDTTSQRWPKLPVVVIVNGFTASSAEIVAGALQDHDRAIVIGRPTYGKGSAQAVIPIEGGAAVKLTNALWYTPSGRSIDRPHVGRADAPLADTTRPRYKTDRGRVVKGGGGIVPDLLVGDSTVSPVERRWVESIGANVPQFRSALTSYADEVARRGLVSDPEFTVTPEMREGLWRAMLAKSVKVPRDAFDDAHEAIDRVLGTELSRAAFGVAGAQRRFVHGDAVIARAMKLLTGVTKPDALFKRVAQATMRRKADGT